MRLRVDLTRGCVSHTYRRVDSAKPCATTLSALHSCRRTTVVSLVTSPMRGPHAPTNVRRLASFQIFFFFFFYYYQGILGSLSLNSTAGLSPTLPHRRPYWCRGPTKHPQTNPWPNTHSHSEYEALSRRLRTGGWP
jgi:hypothetical protein